MLILDLEFRNAQLEAANRARRRATPPHDVGRFTGCEAVASAVRSAVSPGSHVREAMRPLTLLLGRDMVTAAGDGANIPLSGPRGSCGLSVAHPSSRPRRASHATSPTAPPPVASRPLHGPGPRPPTAIPFMRSPGGPLFLGRNRGDRGASGPTAVTGRQGHTGYLPRGLREAPVRSPTRSPRDRRYGPLRIG